MNFWHYTKRNELILEANLTELRNGIYNATRIWFPKSLNFLTECFILYFLPLNNIVHRIRVKSILEKMNFVNVVLVFVYLV